MNNRTDILDLRTALNVLRETPGQLMETNVEVDPAAELSGVYRYVGAGGTVKRPTTVDGPAMIFHNIKGHPGASVAIGVLASRVRVANLFGCKKEELGHLAQSCAANPIEPVVTDSPAPCQEIIHRAEDAGFDLFKLIPAPNFLPLVRMMVSFTVMSVMAMAAAAGVISAEPVLPVCGQFFQQGLKSGFFFVGKGLEQFGFLDLCVVHKVSAPVEQAGKAALGVTMAAMLVPVAVVLMLMRLILAAVRCTEVFTSPAALEGIHRAVIVTLGAGLQLIVFFDFAHIKSLLFDFS